MVKEDELFDIFHWGRHGDVAISMDQFSGPALRIMNFFERGVKNIPAVATYSSFSCSSSFLLSYIRVSTHQD